MVPDGAGRHRYGIGQTLGAVIIAIIFSSVGAHGAQGPDIALAFAAGFAAVPGGFSGLRVRKAAPPAPPVVA